MKQEDKSAVAVLGCVGALALVPLASVANGYAVSVLWGWFVVPALHAPGLGIAQYIGIAMVAAICTHQDCQPSKYDSWLEPFIAIFAKPAVALIAGWVVKGFL